VPSESPASKVGSRLRRTARTPLAAGALGGIVVAALGLLAVSAGWVDADNDGPAVSALAPAPTAQPASDSSDRGALSVGDIYDRTAPGVVFIEGNNGASGSGFVIDTEGHVITNAHVVEGTSHIDVTLEHDGDPVSAEVVGTDPSTDIAVLKVDADSADLHPLPLGEASGVEVGDPVVAIGNPFGLDRTVTSGIVSALQRQISAPNNFTISDVIQTDAPINPGNSGGPLIDAGGRVIGVNSQIATGGSGNGSVGIGFAVPVDTVRDVAEQILASGEVEHAYAGLTLADLDPRIANVLNLSVDSGALVQDVEPGGPADEAGVRAGRGQVTLGNSQLRAGGDVIVAIDGEPVDSADDVISAVNERQPGDELTLEVVREGEHLDLTLTLGNRPASASSAGGPSPAPGPQPPRIPGLPPLPGIP
jgi:S1-C subfamily serine protease